MQSGLSELFEFGGKSFRFELCNKLEFFGSTTVNQWWMPVTELYAQREQKNAADQNHRMISDFYWMMCRAEKATDCRDAQERFLLAKLLPKVRSQGSRTIFADAFLRGGSVRERKQRMEELDALLSQTQREFMTRAQFHQKTHEILGRQEYPSEIQHAYDELTSELFDQACVTLERDGVTEAVAILDTQWQQFQKEFGRRAGHAERKLVLDVLSYEARAAFHHCYSVVWCSLLPRLGEKHRLSKPDWHFHHLWHFDKIDEDAAARGECLSLFHGHVLGLHPGTGYFLQCPAGRELMGQWIVRPESEECFGRLLYGLQLSLFQYILERDSYADDRRRQVHLSGRDDLVTTEELELEKKSGLKRKKKL
jgi:hypothetical protein